MRTVGFCISFLGLVLILAIFIIRIIFGVSMQFDCTQYTKRAADANTIELAKSNLDTVIKYLDKRELTNGVVSIFFNQPKNDIGYWYSNLKESQKELEKVPENASQLEKSNMLMKLRETLIDSSQNGVSVTAPDGLSIYPYNKIFFWLIVVGGVMMFVGWMMVIRDDDSF